MREPEEELADLRAAGLLRNIREVTPGRPPFVHLDGREVLNFSGNDYLGLSRHRRLEDAAHRALETWGTGATASRLISGSLPVHHELETRLAELKGCEAALSFSSGYACSLGALPAVVGKGDVVILDKLCHASLVDGARLSGATLRVFPHNGLAKLERLLARARERLDDRARILVVTESVFSMDGDCAPLAEIVALKERHGALLLVDEAHAIGVLGARGQGLAEELALQQHIDFQMGTLSKAVGAGGGYLAASRAWIELLRNRARSLIYSTAPPPPQAAAALAGLDLIAGEEGRTLRKQLHENIRWVAEALSLPRPASAILPVIFGENEAALRASRELLESGLLVPAIRYPTVPRQTARLRITLSAAHRRDHLDALARSVTGL